MKQALIMAAFSLAVVGCATIDEDGYNKLYAEADNEIKLANKTGFLWGNTEKFLKESKEAMAAAKNAGDGKTRQTEYENAMKLAKKALSEAKLAQQQAKDNAKPDTKIP